MALMETIRHKSELGEALDVSQPAFTVNNHIGRRLVGSKSSQWMNRQVVAGASATGKSATDEKLIGDGQLLVSPELVMTPQGANFPGIARPRQAPQGRPQMRQRSAS